jgi:hypothetical protein
VSLALASGGAVSGTGASRAKSLYTYRQALGCRRGTGVQLSKRLATTWNLREPYEKKRILGLQASKCLP